MKSLHLLPNYLERLTVDLALLKWPMAVGMGLVEYILPGRQIQEAAVAVLALIVLDTVTGLWAARVKGIAITSARMGRVFTKLLGYGSVLVVIAAATRHVPGIGSTQEVAAALVLGLIIATEGVSVLENCLKMELSLPVINVLLEKLRPVLEGQAKPPAGGPE